MAEHVVGRPHFVDFDATHHADAAEHRSTVVEFRETIQGRTLGIARHPFVILHPFVKQVPGSALFPEAEVPRTTVWTERTLRNDRPSAVAAAG